MTKWIFGGIAALLFFDWSAWNGASEETETDNNDDLWNRLRGNSVHFFTMKNCPPCKWVKPLLIEKSKEYGFDIYEYSNEVTADKKYIREYGVFSYPTVIFESVDITSKIFTLLKKKVVTSSKYQILDNQIIRSDSNGKGHYGASRGSRKHKGVDLLCTEYQDVFTPFDGTVRTFYAYKTDKKYFGIEVKNGNTKVKIMYVTPIYKTGDYVKKGQVIAHCQDIRKKYSKGMLNHIHVEKFVNNKNVDVTNDLI